MVQRMTKNPILPAGMAIIFLSLRALDLRRLAGDFAGAQIAAQLKL